MKYNFSIVHKLIIKQQTSDDLYELPTEGTDYSDVDQEVLDMAVGTRKGNPPSECNDNNPIESPIETKNNIIQFATSS